MVPLLFLQQAQAFPLLLADALLFETEMFFTLAAHLFGIVDAVEVRFVGFVGFSHDFSGLCVGFGWSRGETANRPARFPAVENQKG